MKKYRIHNGPFLRQSSRYVVMETVLLVLRHFKNIIDWELNTKIISKDCELMKLCHINWSDPVFLRHTVYAQCAYPDLTQFTSLQ